MVLVALALRLVVVGFLYPERLNPERDHWRFAGETGRIARSLAEGKGFANPLFGDTGPTAWMTPIYPTLVAGTFRIFGVYTKASAIFLLSMNSLFSALTCLPVFFMARRSFGETTAWRSGWAWVFFPYAIYFPADFIWATALTTLLLPLAFMIGLELDDSPRMSLWIWFGLVSGLAAMNDAIVLSVLPVLGLWMLCRTWRRQKSERRMALENFSTVGAPAKRQRWMSLGVAGALAFSMVVAPWFIRNYEAFHKIIPFRDNFGLELYVGNNGDSSHFISEYLHPTHNDAEWEEYARVGELAYMEHKQDQAAKFISGHKAFFVGISLRRALYMWTNFWSLSPQYLKQEPFDPPAIFLCTILTMLALRGLWAAWQEIGAYVAPYALALFFFPLVYYVTHPEDYYRRPIDPFFVVLAVYAVTDYLEARQQRSRALELESALDVQPVS